LLTDCSRRCRAGGSVGLDPARPVARSTCPDTRSTRYRIADPYLRFWLALLADGVPLVERGRGDLVMTRLETSWSAWRGRAVEPLVRDAVARLAVHTAWPDVADVGG
jgi:hypothetical protein